MKTLSIYIVASFLLISCISNTGKSLGNKEIKGFWQGEFKPDPTMKTVFYFWEDGETLKGNSFISSKDSIAYEDPLDKISIKGSNIEFSIPTQGIHFVGKITKEPLSIKGQSHVPGGLPLELSFVKAEKETVWHTQEIISRCKKLKIHKKN